MTQSGTDEQLTDTLTFDVLLTVQTVIFLYLHASLISLLTI